MIFALHMTLEQLMLYKILHLYTILYAQYIVMKNFQQSSFCATNDQITPSETVYFFKESYYTALFSVVFHSVQVY